MSSSSEKFPALCVVCHSKDYDLLSVKLNIGPNKSPMICGIIFCCPEASGRSCKTLLKEKVSSFRSDLIEILSDYESLMEADGR